MDFLDSDRVPLGLVLAGGSGRRIGGDKASRRYAGLSWAEHAAKRLEPLSSEVIISLRSKEQAIDLPGYRKQYDPPPGGNGPLPAIGLALRDAPAGIWVLACDYLLLRSETLRRLLTPETVADSVAASCFRDREGRLHPLAGYWSQSALDRVERCVAMGELSVQRALGGLTIREQTAEDLPDVDLERELLNVNRAEDLPPSVG